MPLDPQVQTLLDQFAAAGAAPIDDLSPAQARRQMLAGSEDLGSPVKLQSVTDTTVTGPDCEIPVRIYDGWRTNSKAPAVVYFHGGGWVIGSIETHDHYCRSLADAANAVVISVDYRLAPEHRFPAAFDDSYLATQWAADRADFLGFDTAKLYVAGDSAGGNLAAAVALAARDRNGPPIAGQALIYPITDCDLETASYHKFAEGYFLTRDTMRWFWDHYLPQSGERLNPLASPLRAESLHDLPPALVIIAEYDPLRDEAEAYAARLAEAGGRVKLSQYDGVIHGFARRLGLLSKARQALQEVAEFIQS